MTKITDIFILGRKLFLTFPNILCEFNGQCAIVLPHYDVSNFGEAKLAG